MRSFFANVRKNNILGSVVKSFLTAYALSASFHMPLQPTAYETRLDYAIASIYELLGSYDFKFILLFVLAVLFYSQLVRRYSFHSDFSGKDPVILPVFFSFCLLVGQSYNETDSWNYCFGSIVNFIKFLLALAGLSILLHTLIRLFCSRLASSRFVDGQEHFFTHYAFRKAFLIIMGAFLPFLLLSFPGNLCWDAIGQIEQVIGSGGYTAHHPLFHTLIMGGLIQLGQQLFHSYEVGLFVYVVFQAAALAAALAATISVLAKRGAKRSLLTVLLLIYCLAPVYSNMASTAVKDVPYSAAVVGYVICFALLLEKPERINKNRFILGFFLLQLCVVLLRNNGLYVILLSGIGGFIYLFKKYKSVRQRVRCLFSSFVASILAAELILALLTLALGAVPGSRGEMLSVPFQQTARYLQLYRAELSPQERTAIEAVLGDVDTVAASYDPDISDPVKALFVKDSTTAELAAYLKAWIQGFCKHPKVYVEAFLIHVYGWFDPAVGNSIRYEADYTVIRQGGLFPNAEKLLIFYYRFASRISLLAVFENVGAAVWALFILAHYQKKRGEKAAARAGLPLWISLLICMASPCFFNHSRYAYPILFTIPFLYGFTLTGITGERKEEKTAEIIGQKG